MAAEPELSAATAQVLLELDPARAELVRLALKELVLRGAWRLEHRPGGLRGRPTLHLVPGRRPTRLPAPLPFVDHALRATVPTSGRPVRATVRALRRRYEDLPEGTEAGALRVLVRRGLLEERRERVLGVVPRSTRRRTGAGDGKAFELRLRLARRDPDELGGLVLLLGPGARVALRVAARSARADDAEDPTPRPLDADDERELDALASGDFDAAYDGEGTGG